MPRVLLAVAASALAVVASAVRRAGGKLAAFSSTTTRFAVESFHTGRTGASLYCTAREALRAIAPNGDVHDFASGQYFVQTFAVVDHVTDRVVDGWDPAWTVEGMPRLMAYLEFVLADVAGYRRLPFFTCEVVDDAHGRSCAKATFDNGEIRENGCLVKIRSMNPRGSVTYEIGAYSDSRAAKLRCTATKPLQISENGQTVRVSAGGLVAEKSVSQKEDPENKPDAEMRYVEAFKLMVTNFDPKQDGFVCQMMSRSGAVLCEESNWGYGREWRADCGVEIAEKSSQLQR